MLQTGDQPSKVEQTDLDDMGQVLRFPVEGIDRGVQAIGRSVNLRNLGDLPESAGVYLVCESGHALYVGQSVNLRKRWSAHEKLSHLLSNHPGALVSYKSIADRKERNSEERRLIRLHTPRLNGISLLPNEGVNYSRNKGHEATGRTREHLTPAEMDRLLEKAKRSGQPGKAHRNHCLVLTMYRHGLRVGEAASLKWSDVDLDAGNMFVRRSKGSKPSTQPINGDEIRALRKLQRESKSSPYVFGAIAPVAISKMIQRLGDDLFGFPIHAHMLRHSTGYYLANKGIDTRTIQDYLGHCNIQHTTRYTELAPGKFRNLWD